jgi:hypothetical protein
MSQPHLSLPHTTGCKLHQLMTPTSSINAPVTSLSTHVNVNNLDHPMCALAVDSGLLPMLLSQPCVWK